MRCPHCGHRLLEKGLGSKLKLRTNILIFSGDGSTCSINCPEPSCRKEIQVPIVLEKSAIPEEPKLVIVKGALTPRRARPVS